MFFRVVLVVAAILIASSAYSEEAALIAPREAGIGKTVEVQWNGPGEDYDSVYVIAPTEPDSASGIHSVSILSKRNPIGVVMPESPGVYELRYLSRAKKVVLARATIRVVDIPTTITSSAHGVMGSTIEVTWAGPGNQYDQIVLVDSGAPDDGKVLASSGIVSQRNPVALHLPDLTGRYELRYMTRQTKRILARRSLIIDAIPAAIMAPEQADIGATIEVSWEGPGNQYDTIGVYAKDGQDDSKALVSGSIISKRNPIQIRLPEAAGEYELRYRTSKSKSVLARRLITIGNVKTVLGAPENVTADTMVMIDWQGPGNDYDQIGTFEMNAPDDAKPLTVQAILSARNPLPLHMPKQDGKYELRYRTTQSGQVLARRPIRVEPAGRLAVVYERIGEIEGYSLANSGDGAVELILDASGSMLQRENGTRRIDIARKVLTELVEEHLGVEQQFALRVFGHREAEKCRTDLEIPLGSLDKKVAATRIQNVNAMNLAKTPIADSLAKVPSDLAGIKGPKTVVLITDGEETCDGDPLKVITQLRASGLDVQVSIVGFAIDNDNLRSEFEQWAAQGGGSYFDARSADDLTRSLRTVISGPFAVLDQAGSVVGRGIIGGAQIVLPAGTYTLQTNAKSARREEVTVKAGELTEVAL